MDNTSFQTFVTKVISENVVLMKTGGVYEALTPAHLDGWRQRVKDAFAASHVSEPTVSLTATSPTSVKIEVAMGNLKATRQMDW